MEQHAHQGAADLDEVGFEVVAVAQAGVAHGVGNGRQDIVQNVRDHGQSLTVALALIEPTAKAVSRPRP